MVEGCSGSSIHLLASTRIIHNTASEGAHLLRKPQAYDMHCLSIAPEIFETTCTAIHLAKAGSVCFSKSHRIPDRSELRPFLVLQVLGWHLRPLHICGQSSISQKSPKSLVHSSCRRREQYSEAHDLQAMMKPKKLELKCFSASAAELYITPIFVAFHSFYATY